MPLKGKDKTEAKQRIMKLVTPHLVSTGLHRISGGRTGGRFDLVVDDGARLVLLLEVPTFDTFYRMWCYWEMASGDLVAYGPRSLPYECPNTPGRRRYTFRFHRDAESHQRCATEIAEWIRNELLPWFAIRPRTDWSNPHVIKA